MRIRQQIEALRAEAASAGDVAMVETCDLALSAPEGEDYRVDAAINRCLQVIGEAEAQRN